MKCPKCKTYVKDGAIFCTQCGARLDDNSTNEAIKTSSSNLQDERHAPTILEKIKKYIINLNGLKDKKISDGKVKIIKVLSWFFIIAIAVYLVILLVNVFNTRNREQFVEEDIIKNRIDNLYRDVTSNHANVDEKYISENLGRLMDKAFSLVEGPEYIDYNIWTNSQDYETLTANIIDCYFVSEVQAIVKLQVVDSHFGELTSPTLYLLYENGDWFVDDIIEAGGRSLKIHTIKFIQEKH